MSLWFKHDAHFHEHPKCLRMRRLAQGKADTAEVGWWRIIAAAKRVGSWTFEDEEHLKDASGRYYGFVRIYREVGLLDGLTIHNGDEYQGPATSAERVAKHRASNAAPVTPVVTDVTPRESREERQEKSSPDIAQDDDPAVIYFQLTGKFPAGKALDWIDGMSTEYGTVATTTALVQAHIADRSTSDLLGRTSNALRADARKQSLKEREATAARIAAERAQPRKVEPWREEMRKALEATYHYDEPYRPGDAA